MVRKFIQLGFSEDNLLVIQVRAFRSFERIRFCVVFIVPFGSIIRANIYACLRRIFGRFFSGNDSGSVVLDRYAVWMASGLKD
jgi:hypothetical protein